jgi:hypothetical protein
MVYRVYFALCCGVLQHTCSRPLPSSRTISVEVENVLVVVVVVGVLQLAAA